MDACHFLLRARQHEAPAIIAPTIKLGNTSELPFAKESPGVPYAHATHTAVTAAKLEIAAKHAEVRSAFFDAAIALSVQRRRSDGTATQSAMTR